MFIDLAKRFIVEASGARLAVSIWKRGLWNTVMDKLNLQWHSLHGASVLLYVFRVALG